MPRRDDIETILILGSGPIVIGQAAEFDYSGVQACKVLREEGYRVVLVNSNPATIMTDPEFADATYVEPLRAGPVAKIIERERPDALLPTLGGQTALNLAKALHEDGTLARFGVELIGANYDAIACAEDRELFGEAMAKAGLSMPASAIASGWIDGAAPVSAGDAGADGASGAGGALITAATAGAGRVDVELGLRRAREALPAIGLPCIVRPAYTLGGRGGGIARTEAEFETIVKRGLEASPIGQVLLDQSVLGWGEFELEVMRDKADNVVIVCSIENVDPMGVHTGDSVTVAPQQTLTDVLYQRLRDQAIAVIRAVGVETGGSNVQFAVNPATDEIHVIEMNPRVSRSSALASKATGFPIAKIAARLAVGYLLEEITNDITGVTPASFEPTIDYVVVKWPRFAFEKFPGATSTLTTHMKSVGESMAIGRTFAQAFAKALRSRELDKPPSLGAAGDEQLLDSLTAPAADRYEAILELLRRGGEAAAGISSEQARGERSTAAKVEQVRGGELSTAAKVEQVSGKGAAGATIEQIHERTAIDPWFLRELQELAIDPESPFRGERSFKAVDTCAAEFPARTPYYYSGWERRAAHEVQRGKRPAVVILGGGPNRIGQGIEFDYCCVHAAMTVRESGREAVIVNCNPETVSTDYDTSDRLYFEPLTLEDVLGVIEIERNGVPPAPLDGVILQFGGQTPLKLAAGLARAGVPLLGTSVDAIDLAEDRGRFGELLERLGYQAPPYATACSVAEALQKAEDVGYPLLVRPSYVLGGRAMEIVYSQAGLADYLRREAPAQTDRHAPGLAEGEDGRGEGAGERQARPSIIFLDRFLENAVEVDVDALCDGEEVWIGGIMQHVEEAGVHSGDSACVLPPHSLGEEMLEQIRAATRAIALGIGVVGLINVQYAVYAGRLYVIEANPRASRTVPFVSKAVGLPLAKLACRIMLGDPIAALGLPREHEGVGFGDHVSVKEAVLPFDRFDGADSLLGPEMRSTGEVMGIARDFPTAFAKAQAAAGSPLPTTGTAFISVTDSDKTGVFAVAQILHDNGFRILATRGTAEAIARMGVPAQPINKIGEGSPHVVDWIERGEVGLIVNTPTGSGARSDGWEIRRSAVAHGIPCLTTLSAGVSAARAIAQAVGRGEPDVLSLQELHRASAV